MSIQTLRDKSEGIVAKILIALIVLAFGLFGFGSITTFLAPKPKVATVNGEKITPDEVQVAVERNRRLLIAQGRSASDIDEDQLRQQVLQNLINRKLLSHEAERLGLQFSEKDLDAEIVATKVFQVDGQFNADQFQRVVGGAGYTPMSYRKEMRTDKELQQLVSGIRGSAIMTEAEVVRSTSLAQQKRDIAFVKLKLADLEKEVNVSDDEIKNYYDNHKPEFKTKERVKLSYIDLDRKALAGDVKVTDEDLRKYYENTKASYATQEERRVAHILIETNDKVSDAEAKAKAEDIYKKIEDGADFAEMAKKYSQDPGSASKGGDLGYNPKGSFVKPFEEAEFSLKPNQISPPVKTEFGYHIIKLLGVKPGSVPDFADVRDKVEQRYRDEKAEELFVNKSSKLSELAFESADLEQPAEELGLKIHTTDYLARNDKTGIAALDGVMEAAFSPDVLDDGNNSSVIEVSADRHIVVHVKDHKLPEEKSLADVSGQIHDLIAKDKATALATSRAKEIVDMLDKGSVARFVADKYGLEWKVSADVTRSDRDIDQGISSEAFKLPRPPEGKKSVGYTLLPNGDAAVITVTKVQNEPVSKIKSQDVANLQRVLQLQEGTYEYMEFRNQLAESGEITRSK